MPRSPRLLPGLSIANGLITLITAIAFAAGDYGAFRAQDSGAFRAIAGLLVAFAAIVSLSFAAASLRRSRAVVAGLALVDALANGVFFLSPFHVPGSLHLLVVATSVLVFCVAITEAPTTEPSIAPLSIAAILFGATVGGLALIGVGRYEFAPGEIDAQRITGLAIAIVGLTLFALGTGSVVTGRSRHPWFHPLLVVVTAAACSVAIRTGVVDLQREGVGSGSFAQVGNPWSLLFWLLLGATLAIALLTGAFSARESGGGVTPLVTRVVGSDPT